MGNELSEPVTIKNGYSGEGIGCEYGFSWMQGYREDMEDQHIHKNLPGGDLMLGIFDGHGGKGCADYVSGNIEYKSKDDKSLSEILEETKEFKQYLVSGNSDGTGRDIKLLQSALVSAFVLMDNTMRTYLSLNPFMAETFGGCTAVVVIITPEYIVCANAGDSRAVYSNVGNSSIPLSEDHKPSRLFEEARIKEAGGFVSDKGRVDGILAVSRGFGDFEFKDNKSKGPEGQKVSCIPDFKIYPRGTDDEMIILACDGLWDVCTNDDAIGFVRGIWDENKDIINVEGTNQMQSVAEIMCDLALRLGSNDNISVGIVKLSNSKNLISKSPYTGDKITNTFGRPESLLAPVAPLAPPNTKKTHIRPQSAISLLNTGKTVFKPESTLALSNTEVNNEKTPVRPQSAVALLNTVEIAFKPESTVPKAESPVALSNPVSQRVRPGSAVALLNKKS